MMTAPAVLASLVLGAALLPRPGLAGTPEPAKLDARRMLGPFVAIDDFCRSLRKGGLLDCARTGGGGRSALGARGSGASRIQAARLVPLRRVHGSGRPVDIAIAMRMAAGWFVDPGRAPERARRTDDVRIDRAKAEITWLDEIDAGVLGVSVEREGEVHRIRRSGADSEEASTARNERDERYCGIGAGGVPSCTDELVSTCNGSLDAFPNAYFEADFSPQADTGRVAVTIHANNPSSCTFGLVPAEAHYALPFAGIRLPAERRFAEDLIGPFASLESHCREMREPAGGRCLMQPGRWNRRVKMLGPRGRVRQVRLFRVRGSVAGVPVEYCRIAVATADGWYVNPGLDHCQGDVGSQSVQTEALTLTWADGGPDPAFVITFHRREDEAAFVEGEQRPVGVDSDETERGRLCVVPSKGPPRCGREHIAACRDADRQWRKATLTVENGVLAARPDPKVACASGVALGAALGGD